MQVETGNESEERRQRYVSLDRHWPDTLSKAPIYLATSTPTGLSVTRSLEREKRGKRMREEGRRSKGEEGEGDEVKSFRRGKRCGRDFVT